MAYSTINFNFLKVATFKISLCFTCFFVFSLHTLCLTSCTTRFGISKAEGDGGQNDDGNGGECGNGILEAGESCDGTNLGGATCESVSEGYKGGILSCLETCEYDTSSCTPKSCGDGVLDFGEECDDGNDSNNDECLNTCKLATCGDGVIRDEVEECDDGNDNNNDECLNNCKTATCGDGVIQDGVEECDDGNNNNNDECLNNCKTATCGDGVIQDGVEECDGSALGEESCESLGFLQGELRCSQECLFDTTDCVQCGDCKSCTKTKCYRDIYWWSDSECTIPYGNCTPCSHWGPASSTHSDGAFFCNENEPYSPYWNGGPCDWVEVEYEKNCDECGSWTCR